MLALLDLYRNVATPCERTFNRLKACRSVAMRTDKRDYVYRGTIDVACIKLWLRDPARLDP